MKTLQDYIDKLNKLNFKEMYNNDFFWTWDKTDEELEAVFTVADALRFMREHNISTKVFESGLGISIFRDNSTRTRFSFASACNLLGLEVQDLDEKKSQIAHGETVRETANMVSFMADVIGIRDDMYIGKGHTYQKEFMDAVTEGNKKPDFIFPSKEAYHNSRFSVDSLISLAAKTTCKDRWRQVINEADRLKGRPKYLCTLQQGISGAQMDEMQAENVILVVPQPYIKTYPSDRQDRIWTLSRFVQYVKAIEGK